MICKLHVQYLDCNRGRRLYRAAMRPDIVSGHLELDRPCEETLFVSLLHFQPDVLPAELFKRDTFVPCRFFVVDARWCFAPSSYLRACG